ncbi:MAG: VOC family protein [Lachnospiraceae bacterium]|nr:VOC family protein [Lachnospiraceae bacterium]
MKYKLTLSTIIVKDIDESISFYHDVLGFEMIEKFYQEEGGLVLMQSPDGAAVELIDSKNFETGFWSIGVEVEDFDAAIEELRRKGCTFVYEPATLPLGKLAMILDPNGVKVAVIELNKKHEM